jgi:hypothetical protein
MFCLAAALLLTGIAQAGPVSAPPVDPAEVVAASGALVRATSDAPIHAACQTLFHAFFVSGARTPELDAAVVGLRDLMHARKSADERVWCLRNIRNAVTEFCRVSDATCAVQARPYEPAFAALSRELLTDPDPAVRIVGARGAWGWGDPEEARIMLGRALDDPSPAVRAAMFDNILWPMQAARAAGTPDAAFLEAVDRGMRDLDPAVFTAALGLDGYLRRDGAAPTIRAFAASPDPIRRIAAIAAAGGAIGGATFMREIVEDGLIDPDVRVRHAALDAIKFPTKRARERLTTMMRTAPTRDERENAKGQLAAFGDKTVP